MATETVRETPAIAAGAQNEPVIGRIEPWLSAVEEASGRSRWLTIVLTIATVVAFFAYWNSLRFSWFSGREEVANAARRYVLASEQERCKLLTGHDSALYDRARRMIAQRGWDIPQRPLALPFVALTPHMAGADTGTFNSGLIALPDRGFTRGDTLFNGIATIDWRIIQLDRFAAEIERSRYQKVVVLDVPFLGITFDVNDLGLIVGLAFVAILMMRKMCLNNEHSSLKATFSHAYQNRCLREAYEVVSIRQVLTAPTRLADVPLTSRAKFWRDTYRVAAMAIDVIALSVLFLIYIENWATVDRGLIASPMGTWISMSFTMLLLFIASALTALSLWTEMNIGWLFDKMVQGSDALIRQELQISGTAAPPSP